jgi:hypothetical protein
VIRVAGTALSEYRYEDHRTREQLPAIPGLEVLGSPGIRDRLPSSSYAALAIAMKYGDAVVVAPIAQLSFVLTAALAVAFLRERLTLQKGVAVALAVLTVVLFASG